MAALAASEDAAAQDIRSLTRHTLINDVIRAVAQHSSGGWMVMNAQFPLVMRPEIIHSLRRNVTDLPLEGGRRGQRSNQGAFIGRDDVRRDGGARYTGGIPGKAPSAVPRDGGALSASTDDRIRPAACR